VQSGTVVGKVHGALASLDAFRDTELIAPACHDTASAIAGIPTDPGDAAYICSGTWSLVGTLTDAAITSKDVMEAGFTNQGAASGGFCFHTNVNGMWILKQCLESWRKDGRPFDIETLIAQAAEFDRFPGVVPVDEASLLLDGDMPARLNEQLRRNGCGVVDDIAGNEPMFTRIIFESLANRYASALIKLQQILGRRLNRVHILGGGSRNRLLTRLTAEKTGLKVETGSAESSTIGNFAVQLASTETDGGPLKAEAVRRWASMLCEAGNGEAEPAHASRSQSALN
jgi:rhamnulokinase